MTIGDQFRRSFDLRIADRIIQSSPEHPGRILGIDFMVEQTIDKDPDTCKLTLYNTAKETQGSISERGAGVILSAGYGDDSNELFRGVVEVASTAKPGTDVTTEVECDDSRLEVRTKRMQKSYSPGVTLRTILLDAIAQAGLEKGNVEQSLTNAQRLGVTGGFTFNEGFVASGRCGDVISKLMSLAGLSWTAQGGSVIALGPNAARRDTGTILIAQGSGLIGSPEVAERRETKNKKRQRYFKFRSLLQGRIRPGAAIQLRSERIDVFVRAENVTHSGSTDGGGWYTDVEGRQV